MEKLRIERDIRNRDTNIYLAGLSTGIGFVLTCLYIYIYFYDYKNFNFPYHIASIRLYKILLFTIVFVTLSFINLYVWSSCNINYVFIFELNPKRRICKYNFLTMCMTFYNVWAIFFILYLYLSTLEGQKIIKISGLAWIIPLILYGVFFSMLLFPFNIFFRSARYWIIETIIRVAMAPFLFVTFRDFYVGDQLTSIGELLNDTQYIFCIYPVYFSGNGEAFCNSYLSLGIPILTSWPFIQRFFQCLRRYYDSGKWYPHIVNGFKYLSVVITLIFAFLDKVISIGLSSTEWNAFRTLYIVTNIASSIYKLLYDYHMDWGILRAGKNVKYFLLRKEIMFRPIWYYLAMIEDFILRFIWIIMIFLSYFFATQIKNYGIDLYLSLIFGFLEIFRRTIWNIFRVENEHLNNVGEYRAVIDLPLPFEVSQSTPKSSFISCIKKIESKIFNLKPFKPFKVFFLDKEDVKENIVLQEVLEHPQTQAKIDQMEISNDRRAIFINEELNDQEIVNRMESKENISKKENLTEKEKLKIQNDKREVKISEILEFIEI